MHDTEVKRRNALNTP